MTRSPTGPSPHAPRRRASTHDEGKAHGEDRDVDAGHAPDLTSDGDEEAPSFPADATWLITGGLGGFGLATAQWLVERGARHLVLVGRKGAASDEGEGALQALRQAGADVLVAQVDVSKEDRLAALLAQVKATCPPLRGVFHAAMVLDDAPLFQLNADALSRVMAPKVQGAGIFTA